MSQYDPDNVFAKILRGEMPCFKVFEDDSTFVFMDIMPRARGHALVIPKTPMRNLLDGDADAIAAVAKTAQKVAKAAIKAFDADGITVQQFNEDAGGQEVYHYHVHVIPRLSGVRAGPPGVMGDMDKIEADGEALAVAMAGS